MFLLITSLIFNGFSIQKKIIMTFDLQHLRHTSTYIKLIWLIWLESPKSQLSKTFFGLKIHSILVKL